MAVRVAHERQRWGDGRRSITPAAAAGLAVAGLLLLAVAAHVALGWNEAGVLSGLMRARSDTTNLRAIRANPGAHHGKSVELRASVDLIVDGRALVLTDRAQPQDNTILAVVPADRVLPGGLEEQEWVVARGTVQRFDPAQWNLGTAVVERALSRWADGTAVVLESVVPVTG